MSERAELLKKFNKAFATSDIEYILNQFSDNIRWEMIGEFVLEGKEAVRDSLEEMVCEEHHELTIDHIITHGREAAVDGIIKTADGKTIAFCDMYRFSGFKNAKITLLRSYTLELK